MHKRRIRKKLGKKYKRAVINETLVDAHISLSVKANAERILLPSDLVRAYVLTLRSASHYNAKLKLLRATHWEQFYRMKFGYAEKSKIGGQHGRE